MNITRDLSPFYDKGMTVLTRLESEDGQYKGEWTTEGVISDVEFLPQSKIVRSFKKDSKTVPNRYYSGLSFRVTFPSLVDLSAS